MNEPSEITIKAHDLMALLEAEEQAWREVIEALQKRREIKEKIFAKVEELTRLERGELNHDTT